MTVIIIIVSAERLERFVEWLFKKVKKIFS